MSSVTSVIVTLDFLDHRFIINRLNTWLRLEGHGSLLEVDQNSGGEKGFEPCVYLGAFNYFNSYRFVELCKLIKEKYKYHHIHFSLLIINPEGIHHFLEIGKPL
jgi:hypothetical protein